MTQTPARAHAGQTGRHRGVGLRRMVGAALTLGALAADFPLEPGNAYAQTTPARSPLLGVLQPAMGAADGAEPWSVVTNPAGMTGARGFQLGLRHTELTADTGFGGRGTGLYVSHPLPYLSRFSVGGALEILRPPFADAPAVTGKLTLALAYQPLSWLALGLGYAHLFAPSRSGQDGLNSVDFGARLTMGRYAALGVVLHDLPAPQARDALTGLLLPAIERSYALELLARPTGDSRFELAAGLRVGEESHELWPRARLWLRPWRGLSFGAEGSLLYDVAGAATAMGSAPLSYRLGVGLAIDFAHVGGDLFALVGGRSGATPGSGFQGGSIGVRVSAERYPALWQGSDRMVRVDLGGRKGQAHLTMLAQLRRLAGDRRTRAVVIVPTGISGNWACADELRQAILRLRAAGKRVFSYSGGLSAMDYYVASAAERVLLDPDGGVRLAGISAGGFFVRDALERLGIRADLVRIGDYKSAPESYTRNEPTDIGRAQRQGLIDDQFERLLAAVGSARQIPRPQLAALIDGGPLTAQRALAARLVDAVATGEQAEAQIREAVGEGLPLTPLDSGPEHAQSYAPPGIAVVQIHGDIAGGTSREVPWVNIRTAGADTIVSALETAARDPQVRAIVVRIDSPGGSATASDVIARQLFEVAKRKPVVCSLGDVAASGGYYAAAPCAVIFANPSTITGSIGIFGGKVDVSGLLTMLGVRRVTYSRGAHADQESFYRPYTDAERENVRQGLQQSYERFLDTVARGRRMTLADVDQRGQGRVFSGQQALGQRLVDHVGGFIDAVAEARRRGGLDPDGASPLFYYPQRPTTILGQLLGLLPGLGGADGDEALRSSAMPTDLLQTLAGDLLPGLRAALLLLETETLARLPFDAPATRP